jgi:hypothetical protein
MDGVTRSENSQAMGTVAVALDLGHRPSIAENWGPAC